MGIVGDLLRQAVRYRPTVQGVLTYARARVEWELRTEQPERAELLAILNAPAARKQAAALLRTRRRVRR